jgi:hypothetical protein
VVDPAIPQARPAWFSFRLAQWRSLLAEHGLRLLAVELILTVGGLLVALPWLLADVAANLTVAAVAVMLFAVVGSFLTAWSWAAVLVILSQDTSGDSPRVTVGQALREGLRGGGLRLWAWLMVLQGFNFPSLLIFFDADLAVAYAQSPGSMVWQGLSWYIAFATALLPMVIVLERSGIRRAWRLTHSRLSTAIGIVALLALDEAVDWMLNKLPSGPTEILTSLVISIPLSVLVAVTYYVIYRAHRETELSHEDSATR